MGPQQVLSAAAVLVLAASSAAVAAPTLGDAVAVIDLGPGDVRPQINAALVSARLDVLEGNGLDDALAGTSIDRDQLALAAAMADAQSKFGALSCADTLTAAQSAIAIAAARQAAGIAVPELVRAWTYVLLCADRTGNANQAMVAATQLRSLGGTQTSDVDASVLARYPELDALSNREVMELEIAAEVPGADVWVDFRRVGTAPVKLVLTSGTHVIAAAKGSRRGVLTGTVVKKQPSVTVPMPEQANLYAPLAAKVAGWGGKLPPSADLEAVMNEIGARVAIVRHGDTVEAWGRVGKSDKLRRLGADDGVRPLAEVGALAALIADRIDGWNDRSPDPDEPLLTETPEERAAYNARQKGKAEDDEPTPWWIYATIGGAIAIGAVIIIANETKDHTQRIELKYPGFRF